MSITIREALKRLRPYFGRWYAYQKPPNNKGGVGYYIEELAGLAHSSRHLDFVDGELKTLALKLLKDGTFSVKETIAVSMAAEESIRQPFEQSVYAAKLRQVLFVPVCSQRPGQLYIGNGFIWRLNSHQNFKRQMEIDYAAIQEATLNKRIHSNIGLYLQSRTKGAGGKAKKTRALYLKTAALKEIRASSERLQSMQPIKWAGGKSKLLNEINSRLPPLQGRYIEPFLGSGSVALGLIQAGILTPQHKIHLSDSNAALINFFQWVRQDVETLVRYIQVTLQTFEAAWKEGHQKAWYEMYREAYNAATDKTTLDYACMFFCLNQMCFNGLYRVNREGKFNVPIGRKASGSQYTLSEAKVKNLRQLAQVLTTYSIELTCEDYGQSLERLQPTAQDFVYWDPPYFPITATSFTAYDGEFDMGRLVQVWQKWQRSTQMLMSNSDTPVVRETFPENYIVGLTARRSVGAKTRGNAQEVLIANYPILCRLNPQKT
jgi:DNA adenine methylase